MAFHVGQKVVCVDDAFPGSRITECDRALIRGNIYTVRWVGIYAGNRSVHLHEIHRSPCPIAGMPLPYLASRFRPAVERKTDISIFTAMLKTDKVPVP